MAEPLCFRGADETKEARLFPEEAEVMVTEVYCLPLLVHPLMKAFDVCHRMGFAWSQKVLATGLAVRLQF